MSEPLSIRQALPDLKAIVDRVGGDLTAGGRQALVPGPGHSRRDRSLSLRVSPDGSRVLFHDFAGGHSVREIFSYLGIDGASEYKPTRAEIEASRRMRDAEARKLEVEKLDFCAEIWSRTVPIIDTPGARYLWNRGLVLDCADVRFCSAAPRSVPWNRVAGDPPPPEPAPAIVALARNRRGEGRGLHVTFVTEEGKKAFGDYSRLMIGPMAGAALRAAPVGPDGVLAVAEGIETAGAFSCLRGVPTWATFSTSGLKGFEVPLAVRHLIIAADNDANGAGVKAAIDLAERARSGCSVEITAPDEVGDWNDVLMGGGQ